MGFRHRYDSPAIPHVLVQRLEPFLGDPGPDLLGPIAVGGGGAVPVVIGHHVGLPVPLRVVEALEHVPVEPALQVEASGDAQLRQVDRHIDLHPLLRERLAEPGQRVGQAVRLLLRHGRGSRAQVVVGELAQRPLHLVHVESQHPAGPHPRDQMREARARVEGVVQDLIAGDVVEVVHRKRQVGEIGLGQEESRVRAHVPRREVHRRRNVHAGHQPRRMLEIPRHIAPHAAAGVEHAVLVGQEGREVRLAAPAIALQVPPVMKSRVASS